MHDETAGFDIHIAGGRSHYPAAGHTEVNLGRVRMQMIGTDLTRLPAPVPDHAAPEDRVAYQMTLMRKTNRLYRAVQAAVEDRPAARRSAASLE